MKTNLNRRELLLGGSLVLCGACATMPGKSERLPEGTSEPAKDRPCDHDLCRYWRPDPSGSTEPPEQGEPRMGRCSIGLPENT